MKLSDFDYNLPKELIAQQPVSPRDHSRLMVVNRQTAKIEQRYFYDIVNYLQKGDVLVLNNTKVFPARLIGKRQETGGKVEVFLLKKVENLKPKTKDEAWEVLIGNRRKKAGQIIEFERGLKCEIIRRIDQSVWEVRFNAAGRGFERIVEQIGKVPVPPYIKLRTKDRGIKNQYQTIYAKYKGSVAAPTAGFHFTKPLINKLKKKGVQFEFITLHVGLGTFEPVKINDITRHKMHVEYAILDSQTAKKLNQAKKEGRRIIAVGTTTVRTLEAFLYKQQETSNKKQDTCPQCLHMQGRRANKPQIPNFKLKAQQGWTDIFIYPGYQFKFVDAIITNFHLPKSTLIMLISAFAGRKLIFKAYQTAIKKKYRFYSFGDSMFIV